MTPMAVLLVGVAFHLVYIWSIFDIYFKSPIIHGMNSVTPSSKPPAERIIFFVADGCRADKFFEANDTYANVGRDYYSKATDDIINEHSSTVKTKAPFLRSIIETKGSWGVSHTRVPTESRPGHVALFAGFYEDVSAVTKGWKENPVEFDSIFNRTYHSWLFGSPDIVPMFSKGIPHVEEYHYSNDEEDYAKDSFKLDIWVFKHVKELFQKAQSNNTLNNLLRHSRVILFLHLLGIDSNGHAHRPYSEEYLANIALVDSGVEKIYNLVEEFYGYDGKTAYIFTADHGMSNKGAHGDGDPSNTRTPIVAWGAGVRGPEPHQTMAVENSEYSITVSSSQVQAQWDILSEQEAKKWRLDGLRRKDIMQADVSPLMASLIGTSFPHNSVGVLPLAYLSPGRYRAECIIANAEQILSQVTRQSFVKQASSFYFRPYPHLKETLSILTLAKKSLEIKDYENAEKLSQQVITLSVQGLNYFQKYNWSVLMVVISLGYCSWIGVLLLLANNRPIQVGVLSVPVLISLFISFVILALEQSPFTYYLYILFPIIFGAIVASEFQFIRMKCRLAKKRDIFGLLLVLAGLELIIVGYHYRQLFSLLFLSLSIWPFIECNQNHSIKESPNLRTLSVAWFLSCGVMSIFPFLPTDYADNTLLVHIGTILLCGCLILSNFILSFSKVEKFIVMLQGTFICSASLLVHFTTTLLNNKKSLPYHLPLLSWALLIASISIPFVTRSLTKNYRHRIVLILAALAPSYILLSISYEVLFYVCLAIALILWLQLEELFSKYYYQTAHAVISAHTIRISFFFLLFIKIAFFGTGNIASMSSFEISSTYRFVTVFSPFLMGALLVLKILIPFTLVTTVLSVVSNSIGTTPYSIFLLVLAMSDILSVNFFFLVQDQGSWKEIGNSISMFGIVNAQIIFIPLMFLISRLFTSKVTILKYHNA